MDYLSKYRIEIAKYYLEQGEFSTAQIAKFVGFNSTDYFCKVFKKYVGISPKKYVKNTHLHYFSNFNDEIQLIDVMSNYL